MNISYERTSNAHLQNDTETHFHTFLKIEEGKVSYNIIKCQLNKNIDFAQ